MPIDDLTALGLKMREARKNKELTQQELSDLSHVSVKQIANIEKGKMNPSYLILRALAKVLHISLDTLINPDVSLEDEGVNQMKSPYILYNQQSVGSTLHNNLLSISCSSLLICKGDYFTLGHMISSFLEKFNSQSFLRDWLCIKMSMKKAD